MKKGFTLIELLVVVLIIGILSAVALPQYEKTVEKSRATEAETILRSMRDAQVLCLLEQGSNDLCQAAAFAENATFTPPAPWGDSNCTDIGPCFSTKNWNFWVEDYIYAAPLNKGEWVATLAISGLPSGGDYDLTSFYCIEQKEAEYCKKIGYTKKVPGSSNYYVKP